MIYIKNQKVVIKTKEGKYCDAIILDEANFGDVEAWWIQYTEEGKTQVNVMTSEQLDEWNVATIESFCGCGAASVGSVRHSFYCDVI